ncbi:RNA binding (RRM/RBD/RNP motifs) family protein [Striga asiatica]|uniref:RNA binding (RRM/RBD/RNP motifs) family protein n=1 Tax=Striga asiatica TaxID=4170 RepID=A0A5A7P899_STRAF|nr:RNA binding (RRM/RBD/RNP motifs) family protein [Striga asiatica]
MLLTLKQHEHYTPCRDGKILQDPNRSIEAFATHGNEELPWAWTRALHLPIVDQRSVKSYPAILAQSNKVTKSFLGHGQEHCTCPSLTNARLQNLDYAPFIAVHIYTFKNFTIFPPSNLTNNLIVILFALQQHISKVVRVREAHKSSTANVQDNSPPLDGEILVIPVFPGSQHVDVCIDPRFRHQRGVDVRLDGLVDFSNCCKGRKKRQPPPRKELHNRRAQGDDGADE